MTQAKLLVQLALTVTISQIVSFATSVGTSAVFMTDEEAEDLSGSIANHAQGHFPGKDIGEVADIINDALTDPASAYESADGRAIYIKDGVVVLVNPFDQIDGGTAYPTDDAQSDFDKFIEDNPIPKGSGDQ